MSQELASPRELVEVGKLAIPQHMAYDLDKAACMDTDPPSESLRFEPVASMSNVDDLLIAFYAEHDGAGRHYLKLASIGGTIGLAGKRQGSICAFLINPTGRPLSDTITVYIHYWHNFQPVRDSVLVIPSLHSIADEAMVSASGSEFNLLSPSDRLTNKFIVEARGDKPDFDLIPTIIWRMGSEEAFRYGLKIPLKRDYLGEDAPLTEKFLLRFRLRRVISIAVIGFASVAHYVRSHWCLRHVIGH